LARTAKERFSVRNRQLKAESVFKKKFRGGGEMEIILHDLNEMGKESWNVFALGKVRRAGGQKKRNSSRLCAVDDKANIQ